MKGKSVHMTDSKVGFLKPRPTKDLKHELTFGSVRSPQGGLTVQHAHELLSKYGQGALERARKIILEEKIENRDVRDALCFFMQQTWTDLEYPGLMAMACEAVGGKKESTLWIGASLILLRGAMDVHDDIIDKQATKTGKSTLYGKWGQDLAIIAGDVLFYEGLTHLNEAVLDFPKGQGRRITKMVKDALFEVGTGVAREVELRGNFDLSPRDLMKIITQKSACAEMHARIGAIVGRSGRAQENAIGTFGRLLAVLTMIRDELIDIYEPEELLNRKEKECLPLPLLYAMQEASVKSKVLPILEKRTLSDNDSEKLANIVLQSEGFKQLRKFMDEMKQKALTNLKTIKQNEAIFVMASLLDPIYEDMPVDEN